MSDNVQVFEADARHIQEMRQILDPEGQEAGSEEQINAALERSPQKWAVRRDEKLLGVGFVLALQAGVVQLVTLIRPDMSYREVKTVYLMSHAFLGRLNEEHNPHRVQLVIRTDMGRCHKWAQKMGFTPEGILHQYDPQRNDYIMFAKCRQLPQQQ